MLSSQGGLTCSPTPPDTTPSPKPGPKKNTATQPGGGNAKAKASNDTNKVSLGDLEHGADQCPAVVVWYYK
jgi:hypothetical protein